MRLDEHQRLKSAYYSARIEGNDLTWNEIVKYYKKQKIEELNSTCSKIYSIVLAHKYTKATDIKKAIKNIKSRTLRHHLKKLQDLDLIKKLGVTNGVYYTKAS